MALWNYCAICGKRIEAGDPCLGVEKKNAETAGDSICFDCVKIENINGLGKTVNITDLLASAEAAEKEVEWKNMVVEAAERRAKEAEAQRDYCREKCDVADKNYQIEIERRKAAEARVKKAEKCITEIEEALKFQRYSASMFFISEYRGQKEE